MCKNGEKSWKMVLFIREGHIVRESKLDGEVKMVMNKCLQEEDILKRSHYELIYGHSGAWRTENVRYHETRISLAQHDLRCMSSLTRLPFMRWKSRNDPPPSENLSLFISAGTLEYIYMGLMGPFTKTVHGIKHGLLITDRYLNLTRKLYLKQTTVIIVAKSLVDNWLVP